MNKLILLALLGCIAITAAGGEEISAQLEQVDSEVIQSRVVREPEAGKNKKAENKKDNGGKKKRRQRKKALKKKNKKANKKEKNQKKRERRQRKRGKKLRKKGGKKGGRKGGKKANKSSKKKSKSRRKKLRKTKKQRKSSKKDDKKKERKEKKREKKRRNKGSRQTCTISLSCVDRAVSLMRLYKDKVVNYQNQLKRIKRQNTTAGKKEGKMDSFKPLIVQLVSQGGGNKSALTCGSSSDNTGAQSLQSLVASLDKCAADIKASCQQSKLAPPPSAETDKCSQAMTDFGTEVAACQKLTGAAACTCFEASKISALEPTVRACDLSGNASAFATAASACRSAFSACRKEQDKVAGAIFACSVDTSAALSKLNTLTINEAAVKKAIAAANALATRRARAARQTATCASLIADVEQLITLINENSASPNIATLADKITGTQVTCSADEKSKLKASSSSLEEASKVIAADITATKQTIKDVTGKDPTDAEISAAPTCAPTGCDLTATTAAGSATTTVATAAPGRRKRLAVEEILKNNIL